MKNRKHAPKDILKIKIDANVIKQPDGDFEITADIRIKCGEDKPVFGKFKVHDIRKAKVDPEELMQSKIMGLVKKCPSHKNFGA